MNAHKTCLTSMGLGLAIAATNVFAADTAQPAAQPTKAKIAATEATQTNKCTEAEINFAKKSGKTSQACHDEKAEKLLLPAVKTTAPVKPAAAPAKF